MYLRCTSRVYHFTTGHRYEYEYCLERSSPPSTATAFSAAFSCRATVRYEYGTIVSDDVLFSTFFRPACLAHLVIHFGTSTVLVQYSTHTPPPHKSHLKSNFVHDVGLMHHTSPTYGTLPSIPNTTLASANEQSVPVEARSNNESPVELGGFLGC